MEPGSAAIAVAIVLHAIAWLFKSPKEARNDLEERMDVNEDKHHALDIKFADFQSRVLTELRHLTDAINRLTSIIGDKGLITSGEHRALRK